MLSLNGARELAHKPADLERKIDDEHIRTLFDAIRQLMAPAPDPESTLQKENEMGFHVREEPAPYRTGNSPLEKRRR